MKHKVLVPKRNILLCLILLLSTLHFNAQFVISEKTKIETVSLHQNAVYFEDGSEAKTIDEVIKLPVSYFKKMKGVATDFGFTTSNYWITFELINTTNGELTYFLETARPITDFVELYAIKPSKEVVKMLSGDGIPFYKRNFAERKTIFEIVLKPNEKVKYYLHAQSDGEALTMPLLLHSTENLLQLFAFEQFVFGFFYGILFIAAILYFFFFFAMREKVFLYYSLYIVFIGLLQFSVDGYFYQFITPNSGWLSLHSVLLSATLANFFLGRYAQVYLKIHLYSKGINKAFYILYGLDLLSFIAILFLPSVFQYCYPLANLLGLVLLILIIASLFVIYFKAKINDWFFGIGVFFLVAGFVIFIFKNFSLLPLNFWTENSSKLGTGLEVIFLSLSMANLIRLLKNEREDLQRLALQRSEEMNELKSYFLSNISHELRTPLNSIMNVIETIATEAKDEKLLQNCALIQYSSKSLLNSVNDILDFSKIEKNELQLDSFPFDVQKIMNTISETFQEKATEKGLLFIYSKSDDFPKQIIGDEARLEQICYDVLSNAIKFTSEGTIQFHLNCEYTSGKTVQINITISDTGIGIAKEKIDTIFESFSQENSNNKRKYYGLGLGLYIVKNLIKLHGGTLEVNSHLGVGSTFKIVLSYPLATPENKSEEPKEIRTPFDLKGKRILVVEDNKMNQMIIKMMTKKWHNTTIEYVDNGMECINHLKEKHFDLILMDLQMPVMDGYEATIAIRNGEVGEAMKNIPIIAVTADVMESTKNRTLQIGMNKYLSKPIEKDKLFNAIMNLI
ncbi:hybrid sensor histidine kinase/response regulator [Flavobacterium amnicola]|uniref:histidine kinase n=1 Tax=Flavobacterium amnicola TaxID=2506422 RepID=A0A4Q1K3P4_9FLAO|nr:hybrid sensor histidine kinase/response regulator [Flavobacterium amnicola]RXR19202.1 hybrid sensor histidine kinase/response regulator [Flavobacterium amnicola]